MTKTTTTKSLKELVDIYKALVRNQEYEKASELIESVSTESTYALKILNKCRIDLNLRQGKIRKAKKIIDSTKAVDLGDRPDDIILCKYLCAAALVNIDDCRPYAEINIELIKQKYPNDTVIQHDLGNYYSWVGAEEKAEQAFCIALNDKTESVIYDYARHLLAYGKISKGIEYYKDRFKQSHFFTAITLADENRIYYGNEFHRIIKSKGELKLVSEQGLGDQIRLLYLAAAIAINEGIEVTYYVNERFSKYLKVKGLNIKTYQEYKDEGLPRAMYALDCLPLLENDFEYISKANIYIEYDYENVSLLEKKRAGVIFSTLARPKFNDSMDIIAPRINEIEHVLKVFNPSEVISLQYRLNEFEIKYDFGFDVLYSKEVDYVNDWKTVLNMARKCSIIVGPDSSQTLLAAMSGRPTIMLVPDKDPMYFNRMSGDSFIKNITFVKISDIRKEIEGKNEASIQ